MMDDKIIQLYDEKTNESVFVSASSFHKYTKEFHGNKALIYFYLVDHMDRRNNTFYGTYASLSKDLCISRPTVTKVMKQFVNDGIVKLLHQGVWEIDESKALTYIA